MAIYRLAAGSVTTSTTQNAVTVGTGNTATIANCVLCNNSSSAIDIDVTINDILITTVSIKAGVGKSAIAYEAIGGLNSGDRLQFTGDGGAYNYYVAGNTNKT